MSQQPFAKLKDGLLSATIWRNIGEDGKERFSITLSRSYKDQNDQWRETNSFSPLELLKLQQLSVRAYEQTLDWRNSKSEAHEAA